MQATGIEWTDFSSNPLKYRDRQTGKTVWACVKHSPGCANCYAEATALRYGRGGPFTKAEMAKVEPFLDEKELRHLLRSPKLAGKRVFIGDMTDVFGEWVPDEMLDRLFAVFALRSDATFQVLTKRADRMQRYAAALVAGERKIGDALRAIGEEGIVGRLCVALAFGVKAGQGGGHPPYRPFPNVWLGVSVEDQKRADERIPLLLQTPAAVRFLSCEPLLGPVNLSVGLHQIVAADRLSWVIVGGESGAGARPVEVTWIRSLVEQCRSAGVSCFMKQLGSKPYRLGCQKENCRDDACRLYVKQTSRKGGDPAEWPADLRVREFPQPLRVSP